MKKEIKIVGAGISGLTSAINLAKAGHKVKVFEKNDVVGKRFHGDYQGIENWVYGQDALGHLQNLGLAINFPYYPAYKGNGIGPDRKVYTMESKKPFFYLVRRGTQENTLDKCLFEQAQGLGVEVIFNSPKDHRKFGDIIAQGYFPDQVTDAIAIGYNFQTSAPEQYWAIIDDNIAPDGYAYCLIAGGRATLAVCMFRDYDKSQAYLDKAYDIFQEFIGFDAQNKKLFGGTGNVFWTTTATFNNRLYVGEAAGFIDGLWGFGIKYAMISGYLAAKSIIENTSYDKLLEKTLFSPLIASLVNRWYYKFLNRKSYQLILKAMKKTEDPISFLKKGTNYSLIHKAGFPLARFFLRKKLKDPRKFRL